MPTACSIPTAAAITATASTINSPPAESPAPISASATATPNGVLDAGEDLNANGLLDTYGGRYNCNGVYNQLAAGGITCADLGQRHGDAQRRARRGRGLECQRPARYLRRPL